MRSRLARVAACALVCFASTSLPVFAETGAEDPLAPLLQVSATPADGVPGARTITIGTTDRSGSGIAWVRYAVDGSAEATYSARFTITRPGIHVVSASARSVDGRISSVTTDVDVTADSALRSTPIQGPDRIWTAIEGSRKAFKEPLTADSEGHRTVVLATAYNWPDALGASSLAGAVSGPVLLTPPTVLPTQVAAEMVRLGADRVIVVGGTRAVSEAVATTCYSVPGIKSVERLQGADRYATSVRIAERSAELLGSRYSGIALVATGADFPDALGASSLAASYGCLVYLVPQGTSIPHDVSQSITRVTVTRPVVLGGTRAVSDSVAEELRLLTGRVPVRLAGSDRYETALAVAHWAVEQRILFWDGAGIATGLGFADAVAGGPVQGRNRSVLLLTDPAKLPAEVRDALRAEEPHIAELRFYGGELTLSQSVRDEALAAVAR